MARSGGHNTAFLAQKRTCVKAGRIERTSCQFWNMMAEAYKVMMVVGKGRE